MSQPEPKIPSNFTENEICQLLFNVLPDGVERHTVIAGLIRLLGFEIAMLFDRRDSANLFLIPVYRYINEAIDDGFASKKKMKSNPNQ